MRGTKGILLPSNWTAHIRFFDSDTVLFSYFFCTIHKRQSDLGILKFTA
jgi:hypothetical protein